MKTYSVQLPITGVLSIEVEAEDEDSAIEIALNSEYTMDQIESWNAVRQIVTGNIFNGERNEAEATEV